MVVIFPTALGRVLSKFWLFLEKESSGHFSGGLANPSFAQDHFSHPQPPSLLSLLLEPGSERKVLSEET